MNQPISLEAINAMAPYIVHFTQDGLLRFKTDFGVIITIDFIEDDLVTTDESYQIILANANKKKSPNDEKVKDTVLAIVTEFLEEHQSALIYLCETNDGKQLARERLFKTWINAYDYGMRFFCMFTSIVDSEGIMNAAAIIIRNDNPNLREIVNEFTEVSETLRQKP
jgi:hypothetical protein